MEPYKCIQGHFVGYDLNAKCKVCAGEIRLLDRFDAGHIEGLGELLVGKTKVKRVGTKHFPKKS